MDRRKDRGGGSRRYSFRPSKKRRRLRLALIAVFAAVGIYSAVQLTLYAKDWLSSQQTADDLRNLYYSSSETQAATAGPTAPPARETETPKPPEASELRAPVQAPTPAPKETAAPRLQAVQYPNNPKAQPSLRFQTLWIECRDAVGWLKVRGMIDEVVVQRDNTFYLDHDAKGKSNSNGALFLDSSIRLKTRPYALLIYGHNMKSGAMFGNLRNYENVSFYHSNPFITFDTLYEDGRYVVFAAGTVSLTQGSPNYVSFPAFTSANARERKDAINALAANSAFTCSVDVQAEDQLLLLVTCVDKDDERRLVAARRLREGESEEQLKPQIAASRKK